MVGTIVDTAEDFLEDPVGTSVDIVTQPLCDAAEVLEGLTEFELREKAALRLGAGVVSGMALSEVIDTLGD